MYKIIKVIITIIIFIYIAPFMRMKITLKLRTQKNIKEHNIQAVKIKFKGKKQGIQR